MRIFVAWFFRGISFVIASLPTSMQIGLANGIGFLWFDILRIRRKVAIENVGIAFPEMPIEERVRLARASLQHMGRTLIEFTHFPFFKAKHVAERFEIIGMEHVERARAENKGVLLLTLHIGNGDYAVAALSRMGLPMHLISKEFKSRWLNDLWFGMRKRHGTRFISPEKSSFDILRALRRNEIVAFVLDQFMGPPVGVRTRFFGKETGTAAGLALMADRTRAAVIPAYTYRRKGGKTAIVFEPPIPYLDNGLRDQNIAGMTQIYTDKVEEIVRRHPEQWMWIHRRWKEFRD